MTEQHRVVASTRLIAALTLVSRILGLAREVVNAHFFGTTPLLSAFRIAFMIPNLSRRLLGEGALTAAFIPVFTRTLREQDHDHAQRLAGAVLTLLGTVLVGLVLLGETGLLVAWLVKPGLTIQLTAITLPFMAFICTAALLGGILNVLGRFASPALVPTILNGFVIVAILAGAYLGGLSPLGLIYVDCVAILLAGVAQVGSQLFSLRRAGFVPALNWQWNRPEIREIIRYMGPMVIGLSAIQINTTLDMVIADYFVPDGQGPAVLGYAQFMYQLPLGVFGIALATAVFPVLSASAAADDKAGMVRTLERGGRLSFFIALHAAVGLILVARPLVAVLFQRGAFGPSGTERVSLAITFYTIGLCAYSLQHILIRALYALKEHRIAARVAGCVVVVNFGMNLLLVRPFGEAGVAMGTAIGATVQTALLFLLVRKRLPGLTFLAMHHGAWKTAVSAAVMGACVYLIIAGALPFGVFTHRPVVHLATAVAAGAVVAFAMGRLLRIREAAELMRR